MEGELKEVVALLAQNRWPFRLHATYDEIITRALERVRAGAIGTRRSTDLHWFFDHAETISDRNIERVKALGGGIAVQHRWLTRASIFSLVMARKPASAPHPSVGCSSLACPSALARMRRALPDYNPFSRSIGSSPAAPSAALCSIRKRTDSTALKHCASIPAAAHGFPGSRNAKAQSLRDNSPTSRCSAATIFSVPEEEIKQPRIRAHHRRRKGRLRGWRVRHGCSQAAARRTRSVAGFEVRRLRCAALPQASGGCASPPSCPRSRAQTSGRLLRFGLRLLRFSESNLNKKEEKLLWQEKLIKRKGNCSRPRRIRGWFWLGRGLQDSQERWLHRKHCSESDDIARG